MLVKDALLFVCRTFEKSTVSLLGTPWSYRSIKFGLPCFNLMCCDIYLYSFWWFVFLKHQFLNVIEGLWLL